VPRTARPALEVTYTQNWPHEPLVGNTPTGSAVVWSVVSFVLLLAGVGGMVWYFASQKTEPVHAGVPSRDPLLGLEPTTSQRATVKYFFVVAALLVVQIGLGAIAAHYGVEGSSFYGFPLDQWLPYSVTRTWHTQLGIFWIATSWLATGLFGFFINPPIALYCMQCLNTTPMHGHAALFGVYGMLGIGLMLFCLRALQPGKAWKEWPMKYSFWGIDVGLLLMVLLPIGLMQTWASVEYGM
jgi:nitric oxide reductase large subunit